MKIGNVFKNRIELSKKQNEEMPNESPELMNEQTSGEEAEQVSEETSGEEAEQVSEETPGEEAEHMSEEAPGEEAEQVSKEAPSEKTKIKNGAKIKEIAICFGIAVLVATVLMSLFFPTKVKGTSMQPTLEPNDRLVISRQAYKFGDIDRGDIIVFESEAKGKKKGKKKLLVKRVIGIPDDIITIAGGNVYMNGSKVKEEYIGGEQTDGDIHNLKVKNGEVFVMGDHRSVSNDSRVLGCIKQNKIKGKAVFRIYPLSKIGGL